MELKEILIAAHVIYMTYIGKSTYLYREAVERATQLAYSSLGMSFVLRLQPWSLGADEWDTRGLCVICVHI